MFFHTKLLLTLSLQQNEGAVVHLLDPRAQSNQPLEWQYHENSILRDTAPLTSEVLQGATLGAHCLSYSRRERRAWEARTAGSGYSNNTSNIPLQITPFVLVIQGPACLECLISVHGGCLFLHFP